MLEPRGKHNVLASFKIDDSTSAILNTTVTPKLGPPRLTSAEAITLARRSGALRSWIAQYPGVEATATLGDDRVWTVAFDDRDGAQVAAARVNDTAMTLTNVRTGPQVDWQLARGEPSSYGRLANRWWVFLPLCALFLGGLVDWRRPFTMRTLDLLALLSFGISLHWFNQGDVFISTPLIYPPLVYLLVRMIRLGSSHRPRGIDIGATHALVLVALCFALVGFRLGLNNRELEHPRRRLRRRGRRRPAAERQPALRQHADQPGDGLRRPLRERRSDRLRPVHQRPLRVAGLERRHVRAGGVRGVHAVRGAVRLERALGRPAGRARGRLRVRPAGDGGPVRGRLAVRQRRGWALLLAFAWVANPFTLYALNMNTNDALVGALLAWFIAALSVPWLRGGLMAAAGLAKLGPLALVPLLMSLQRRVATLAGFLLTSLLLLSMLARQSDGLHLFWERTFHYQLNRVTPLSIWTLGAFHPGWPTLHWLQQALQVAVVLGCLLLAVLPRGRKDAVAVAALAAAALIATQVVSSYWFYPYICWWLPLALFAMLVPRRAPSPEPLSPR